MARRKKAPSTRKSAEVSDTQLVPKKELELLLDSRELLIEPLLDREHQIDQLGIDLRLDAFYREFVRTTQPYVSPGEEPAYTVLREIEPFRHQFYLQPGEFALAQSFEYIALPNNLLCLLNGRSSLGRRGLVVHATANVVDPGWRGHLVFELANLGPMPIELVPLMRIARLIFLRTTPVREYGGSFLGQTRITPPKADALVAKLIDLGQVRRMLSHP